MALGEAMTLALAYAARGVHVFPVGLSWDATKYGGQGGIDKRPLNEHGHKDATTDPREVRRQFNKARLRDGEVYGVGWCPGLARRRFLLDVDDKGDVCGSDELADLEADHGPLPDSRAAHHPIRRRPHRARTPADGTSATTDSPEASTSAAHDGWVVAGGTRTPWGEWAWEGGIGLLEGGKVDDAPWLAPRPARATGTNGQPGRHDRTLDARSTRPSSTPPTSPPSTRSGASVDTASSFPHGKAHIEITRPDKRAGTSATHRPHRPRHRQGVLTELDPPRSQGVRRRPARRHRRRRTASRRPLGR